MNYLIIKLILLFCHVELFAKYLTNQKTFFNVFHLLFNYFFYKRWGHSFMRLSTDRCPKFLYSSNIANFNIAYFKYRGLPRSLATVRSLSQDPLRGTASQIM